MVSEPQAGDSAREIIFYDGHCGLCHALVRFTARRDHAGWFAFAPLAGETFRSVVSHPPAAPPDSVVVHTVAGTLLVRSQAVLHVMRRLGGVLRMAAAIVGLLPRPLLDWGYRVLARLRRRLFPPPQDQCPLVPAPLRSRFRP